MTLISCLVPVLWITAAVSRGADEPSRTIRITAERFHFTPSRIELEVGETVDLELSSEDTFHGFRLPDAGLDVTIPARGKGNIVIRFRADQTGTYSFECSRPCGAGHTMMRGTIVVGSGEGR